jgi:hypothetical protein
MKDKVGKGPVGRFSQSSFLSFILHPLRWSRFGPCSKFGDRRVVEFALGLECFGVEGGAGSAF